MKLVYKLLFNCYLVCYYFESLIKFKHFGTKLAFKFEYLRRIFFLNFVPSPLFDKCFKVIKQLCVCFKQIASSCRPNPINA